MVECVVQANYSFFYFWSLRQTGDVVFLAWGFWRRAGNGTWGSIFAELNLYKLIGVRRFHGVKIIDYEVYFEEGY